MCRIYNYLIVFDLYSNEEPVRHGNAHIQENAPVSNISTIRRIEKELCKKNNAEAAMILNIIVLEPRAIDNNN